ncbi:MAG: alpha/beta hydrolase, partial [Candidatus Baltobacteraceae bacterium]
NVRLHHLETERNPLAVLEYEPRRARGVRIVAGHGYSSSKHNLDFLCGFLASHGFRTFSLDFPGHKLGASGGVLRGTGDLVDAMSAAVEFARVPGEPLYVLGHSMGAMTAIFTAAADTSIAGAIALTTGYGRPRALESLQKAGVTDFRSGYVDGVSLPELVASSAAEFERALPMLAGRPQLYVAASRDAMVSAASVEDLYRRASEPKTFVTIESDHTTAADNARGAVLQWLNQKHPR